MGIFWGHVSDPRPTTLRLSVVFLSPFKQVPECSSNQDIISSFHIPSGSLYKIHPCTVPPAPYLVASRGASTQCKRVNSILEQELVLVQKLTVTQIGQDVIFCFGGRDQKVRHRVYKGLSPHPILSHINLIHIHVPVIKINFVAFKVLTKKTRALYLVM